MACSTASVSAKKRRQRRKRKLDEVIEDHQSAMSLYGVLILIVTLLISHTIFHFRYKRGEDVHRVRKDLEKDIFLPLGTRFFRRSYRMDKDSFYFLHDLLKEDLEQHFFPKGGGTRCYKTNNYLIKTEIRLSLALRFFAGACPYDLIVSHGVSYTSIFYSIWGVVDVINNNEHLKIRFPDINEQLHIAEGFKEMSGANFGSVIGAIDGILIWILKPNRQQCRKLKCGEASFFCSRKDKFGLNMQAICDNKLRFRWIDITWPGCTADYMAWVTSSLYSKIESDKNSVIGTVIRKGMTLVGDNAYVQSSTMSVPFKGYVNDIQDSYNFYQSQLRITIERSFGVLVHRWAILRGPLVVPVHKVAPLVNCLCCLHNYCINRKIARSEASENIGPLMERDACHVSETVESMNLFDSYIRGTNVTNQLVTVTQEGGPSDLVGGGEHFNECPRTRADDRNRTTLTPQDIMVESIKEQGLLRPLVVE
jgi:hypothetical protein